MRLWLGRTDGARDLLERVVVLRPSCFRAHFLLGRIAFDDGRHAEAIQEFAICHRLDPDRFLRLPLPAVLVDEVTTRSLAFPDSPMFDLPPAEAGPLPGEWDDLIDEESWDDQLDLPDGVPPGTDFIDADEYRRFRELPAIRATDLGDVDIDLLLARLVEDPHPGGARDQS